MPISHFQLLIGWSNENRTEMKKIPVLAILLIFIAACAGTKTNVRKHSTRQDIDQFAQYRDTLVGKFDGIKIDTLIAEPFGAPGWPEDPDDTESELYYNWRVYSKGGTVNELILEKQTIGIKFVNEGDVDLDGKDEWGYVSEWPTSNWMVYRLYHNDNGNWNFLIEPTSIWLPHLDPEDQIYGGHTAEDLIQTSDKPGFLNVKFSDLRNDGEDFLLIDTLIQIPNRLNQ